LQLAPAGGCVALEQVVGAPFILGVGDLDRAGHTGWEAGAALRVGDRRLEPAHDDLVHRARVWLDASLEALRVHHGEERLPALGVAVVRGRREEEPVRAVGAQAGNGPGLLAVHGVAPGPGRRRRGTVVRLVDDEEVEEAWVLGARPKNFVQEALGPRHP
jgi:hypothetical protein